MHAAHTQQDAAQPDAAQPDATQADAAKADAELAEAIGALWDRRDTISAAAGQSVRRPIEQALGLLDRGEARVAMPGADGWVVQQWLKQAVLLSFRINDSAPVAGAGGCPSYDKVGLKTEGWDQARFAQAGFRMVPGAVVRRPAHIAPGVVLMPCFVNVGAYIGAGTMIDTWATVGSCAQIGRNCHISGGAGIGGVLEPLQANPVIIEDDCFIGARSEVAEGVIVGRGAVLAMGVFLGASTKIVDRATGEVTFGRVPPYSVVVPGVVPGTALPDGRPGPALACAVIVKRVDERTRAKTSINELLRD
jgi:2,3,4,5-tetrahydropyridine-2-carboxylate N-succinyltransferase